MSRRRTASALVGASALALGLTACAGGSGDPAADNGGIRVVASTSTWGDIAEQVVDDAPGDLDVSVDTILSGTDDDPHEYEATARDIASIRAADIVVGNGAGYDNWLTDNAGDDAEVITAAPPADDHDHDHDHDHGGEHGEDHDHGDNPHVWFDMALVADFADALAAHLHDIDDSFPAEATGVQEMTDGFSDRVADLPRSRVVLTEPVAGPLLKDSAVEDVTPGGFARAVLNEGEPSAADVAATRDLLTDGGADVLVTNSQSETRSSRQLTDAAEDADLLVVNVTETPGTDESYADYVDAVISDLENALS